MKSRSSFVSNSSSTSFCIHGCYLGHFEDIAKQILKDESPHVKTLVDEILRCHSYEMENDYTDPEDRINPDVIEKVKAGDSDAIMEGLEHFQCFHELRYIFDGFEGLCTIPDEEGIYAGGDFESMKPDETRSEFEARIEKLMEENFGKVKCEFICTTAYS